MKSSVSAMARLPANQTVVSSTKPTPPGGHTSAIRGSTLKLSRPRYGATR